MTIIEIMGRHAGWLTAASALARKYDGDNPLFIYLPETDFDQEAFLKDLEKHSRQTATLSSVFLRESTTLRELLSANTTAL